MNISTVTEMVLNEESSMFKKGMVETIGRDDYTGWQVLADEGAAEGEYPFGPSPLSYYTAGLASNLHTQVLRAAEVIGVEVESVTVEVLNYFYWVDMMDINGQGNLGDTQTNIIIESDASEELIEEIIEMALNSWVAGNALLEEVVVEPHLVINGESFEVYNATPGTSNTDVSYDDEFMISSVTEDVVTPTYIELTKEDADEGISFETMNNLEFEIYAVSKSVDNEDRPYLNTVTISTPSGETWEMYSDEFMGEGDVPLAPTSLEYFTLGTSLCLTSQTTLVSAMMGLDYEDYRVEHMFEYTQENVDNENMYGTIEKIHTYIIIESDESIETLEEFSSRALSLCFAG